jgi:hypothetical protein
MRLTLVLLSRWFNWQDALTIFRPRTCVTWHRKDFRFFWRWKSEAGRRTRDTVSNAAQPAQSDLPGRAIAVWWR